jgi:hypothetical protein
MKIIIRPFKFLKFISIILILTAGHSLYGQEGDKSNIKFIDYFFENASPLCWQLQGDSIVKISIMPDYERGTQNRQTDHWSFRLIADKGTRVKFLLSKMIPDVYDGHAASNWWNSVNGVSCYISFDKKNWEIIKTTSQPNKDILVEFQMKGESVYVARMPAYTVTDLEKLKKKIIGNKLVKIFNIGMTVENRPLEIIQLGNPKAPHSIIIRARAHPWEEGGNWVVEGLINKFIGENSKKWQESFCIYIMPMANKDGVARGMTRFNLNGKDLNRNWDSMADSILCPEKYGFEQFVGGLVKNGIKPCLAIDIHNDDYGGIHMATHSNDDTIFIKNMHHFEKLMREHTSFSEKMEYSWKIPGKSQPNVMIENGLLDRFGIETIVYELNANWIGSLNKMPGQDDWIKIGENLNKVFYEYVNNLKK